MTRTRQWSRLMQPAPFDLAVIGAGATGLGVALDAALRGFSVVVLDSHDFGAGTSSRSTKLLHGGVRYLAQGHLGLVKQALAERATVMRIAPHLAQALPFIVPAYHWWHRPFYGVGLKLYDWIAGASGLGATQWLSTTQTRSALPGIQTAGLRGGVQYWDGQFDDARLALALARTIERAGGLAINHAAVTGLWSDMQIRDHGSFTLEIEDQLDQNGTARIRARAVVNATGVWVDELRLMARPAPTSAMRRMVSPSQGVHIVLDRSFMPSDHAMLIPHTRDGRVLFAIPWMGSLLLGTTDTPIDEITHDPLAFDHEIDFILHEAGRYLLRTPKRSDILSVWVGLRPLVADDGAGVGTQTLSRNHAVVTDANRLITVTGGKWTTYRAMAEEVLQTCFDSGLLSYRAGGMTNHHALVGAPRSGVPLTSMTQPLGPHLLGAEAEQLATCPGHDHELGWGVTEAMVRYSVRYEYAHTVEDVLARRWRVLYLDAARACAMAREVAEIIRNETGHDPGLDRFMALAVNHLPGKAMKNPA